MTIRAAHITLQQQQQQAPQNKTRCSHLQQKQNKALEERCGRCVKECSVSLCVWERERVRITHRWKNETMFLSPTWPSRSTVLLTLIAKKRACWLRNVNPKQKHTSRVDSEEGQSSLLWGRGGKVSSLNHAWFPSVVSAEVWVETGAAVAAAAAAAGCAAGTAKLLTATLRC